MPVKRIVRVGGIDRARVLVRRPGSSGFSRLVVGLGSGFGRLVSTGSSTRLGPSGLARPSRPRASRRAPRLPDADASRRLARASRRRAASSATGLSGTVGSSRSSVTPNLVLASPQVDVDRLVAVAVGADDERARARRPREIERVVARRVAQLGRVAVGVTRRRDGSESKRSSTSWAAPAASRSARRSAPAAPAARCCDGRGRRLVAAARVPQRAGDAAADRDRAADEPHPHGVAAPALGRRDGGLRVLAARSATDAAWHLQHRRRAAASARSSPSRAPAAAACAAAAASTGGRIASTARATA